MGAVSHKGRNRDPGRMPSEPAVTDKKSTALMGAQLASLKRNSGSELIKAGDKRLQPKADVTSKRNSRPDLCEADVIAPMDPRVLGRHVTTDVSDDAAAGIKYSCDKSRPLVCNGGSGRSLNPQQQSIQWHSSGQRRRAQS